MQLERRSLAWILLLDIDCWPVAVAEMGDRQWSMHHKGLRLTLQNAAQSEWSLWLILLLNIDWPIFCSQR
jgi:hypothetical protein